jgi:phosphoribosylglycinamide formyltransferase-1
MSKRIGILLSGRGSNFEAIARSISSGQTDAEISAVISNRESAPGLELARQRGLRAVAIPSRGQDRQSYDRLLIQELRQREVDLVCLAGYMRLLSAEFIQAFPMRILNIHPSLLPAFPGLDAQGQAIAHGVKIAGCTVHFVDENLDAGPIILQSAVPVFDNDDANTLAERILVEEHRIYSEAIRIVLSGHYRIEGRRVLLLNPAAAGNLQP